MRIREIGMTRRDRRRFVSVPHRLYRDTTLWLPPMRAAEMASLHPSHPFYRHSEAAFFVAEGDDGDVGRIGVFEHRPANAFHGTHTAFFGWFEAVDEGEVAAALVDVAAEWASARGLDLLVGPKGLLPSDGHGILVEGFDERPVLGVAYHHPYYDALIRSCGFEPAADYLSGRVAIGHDVPDQLFEMADAAASEGGYEVRMFETKRELRPWILRLGHMYNDAMSGNWEYTPVNDEEIEAMADQMLPIADPRTIVLLLHEGEIAGYLLILPDVADAIRAIRGRLLPFGWLRLMRAVRTTDRANIVAMGLVPEHRGIGANLILYAALARGAQESRYRSAEVVQVEEGNTPMIRNAESLGVPWYKRHRMYRKAL